jgi:hypothetical protein
VHRALCSRSRAWTIVVPLLTILCILRVAIDFTSQASKQRRNRAANRVTKEGLRPVAKVKYRACRQRDGLISGLLDFTGALLIRLSLRVPFLLYRSFWVLSLLLPLPPTTSFRPYAGLTYSIASTVVHFDGTSTQSLHNARLTLYKRLVAIKAKGLLLIYLLLL